MFHKSIGDAAYNVLTLLIARGSIRLDQVTRAIEEVKEMPEKDIEGFYKYQNETVRPEFTKHGYGLE